MKRKLAFSELKIKSFVTSVPKQSKDEIKAGASGGGDCTFQINCTGGFACTWFCIETRLCK